MAAIDFPASPTTNQVHTHEGASYMFNGVGWVSWSPMYVPGVQFPATQVVSADPNCFDDYEEGTFTPSYSASTTAPTGIVYDAANRYGTYTKTGRQVLIHGRIRTTSATGAGSGTILITGQPWAAVGTYSTTGAPYAATWTTQAPTALLVSTVLTLYYNTATSMGGITNANFILTAGNDVIFSAAYASTS